MKQQQRGQRRVRRGTPPCGALAVDDGQDPRTFRDRRDRQRRGGHKNRQLCKQVFQALSLAIYELQQWGEPVTLLIRQVRTAPDASRLRVLVTPLGDAEPEEVAAALEQLRGQTGRLRNEVAAAICRKRVPELCFELAAPATQEGNESRGLRQECQHPREELGPTDDLLLTAAGLDAEEQVEEEDEDRSESREVEEFE